MRVRRFVVARLAAGAVLGVLGAAPTFARQADEGPISSAGGQSAEAERAAEAVERAVTSSADQGGMAAPGAPPSAPLRTAGGSRRGKSVDFKRLLVTLAPGQTWGKVETGRFCLSSRPLTWKASGAEMRTPQFVAAFRSKFQDSGIQVTAGGPGAPPMGQVYNLYGVVTKLDGNFCLPQPADLDRIRGRIILEIQWRLFAPLGRKPLATIVTSGDYRQKALQSDGVEGMLNAAFNRDLDQLLEEPAVLEALSSDARRD